MSQSDKLHLVGLSNDLPLLEFSKKRVMLSEYFVKGGLDEVIDAKKIPVLA
jgi:hypothetical protein